MKQRLRFLSTLTMLIILMCCQQSIQNRISSRKGIITKKIIYTESLFPSYNSNYTPPSGIKTFELSQDYPKTVIVESYPWQNIDFTKDPELYMQAVLKYCLEGNIEVDFRGQENKIRKWYHAPWLHDDGKYVNKEYIGNGREYIHGLTREFATPKYKIHDQQDNELENWAVGMYNAPGGYTLGQVWSAPNQNPDPAKSNFPEGTVSFKLLFTDGTSHKIPFLKNTLEWKANIYRCNPNTECADKTRTDRTVRLLQIDIAVKDKRALKTGWVYGTFIYDGSGKGKTVWDRMVPVGLSWGNDSEVTKDIHRDGAFINEELKESFINASLIHSERKNNTVAYLKYHGLGGRLNGPIDNSISSCISCHGNAAVSRNGLTLPLGDFKANTTRFNYSPESFKQFFMDVPSGANVIQFKEEEYTTTDYSLQISIGIRNYYSNKRDLADGLK
ncbi:hypothetical protein CEY12_04160 [Chryseobacterium sp. T16E-39]|uniref:hypothetical protein n=1 Tax=Chryseobacterium sp. T16E-39 TaxID=2015076 RepID=UPI000B5B211C|nr:hypothetical protein [Chryseobacterium sp. T16E-39]ASK29341.1 hypothetical protein CEY12_04160 [Chryseobacterium sp. T16E-39]